jgi:hypothetical protein
MALDLIGWSFWRLSGWLSRLLLHGRRGSYLLDAVATFFFFSSCLIGRPFLSSRWGDIQGWKLLLEGKGKSCLDHFGVW